MKTLVVYSNVDGFAVQLKNHVEDALTDLQIEWQECHLRDVAQVSEDFQPTMHVFFHPNKEIYEYLEVIQSLKGHKLLWQLEDPYESDLTFEMLPYFYYIFTSDQGIAEALKKESKDNLIQFVPHACNPKVHKPMDVPYEYRSDVLFVGNAYESRLKYLQENAQQWKNQMFTLIGVGYRGLDGFQNQRVIHGHISEEEMVKYINGAKLVLNMHRQKGDLDMGNERGLIPISFNNRYYEVGACGRQQLVIGRPDKDGKDSLVYELGDPNDFSYKARLTQFYMPLLKK